MRWEPGYELIEGKLCYPPRVKRGRIFSAKNAQVALAAVYLKSPEIAEPPRANVQSERRASSDHFAIPYLKQLQVRERGRAVDNKFRLEGIKRVAPPALAHAPGGSPGTPWTLRGPRRQKEKKVKNKEA